MGKPAANRAEVEDFLYEEAALLDGWKLQEWLALFTDDAGYFVPSASLKEGDSPDRSLFYIADDRQMLGERVARLYKQNAYAEIPHSKTRHVYSNIRISPGDQPDEIIVRCYFMTHRSRTGKSQTFVGISRYCLLKSNETFLIREKYCVLDTDDLNDLGRISIIL